MTSEIIYTGNLRTQNTHTYSGSVIETDAPLDNHGLAQRFSPTDLVATALGACMLSIMGIKARDMNVNIDGAKCEIYKTMDNNPRRISAIEARITMPAGNYTDKTRTILMNAAKSCPVSKSLNPDIVQNVIFMWPEN